MSFFIFYIIFPSHHLSSICFFLFLFFFLLVFSPPHTYLTPFLYLPSFSFSSSFQIISFLQLSLSLSLALSFFYFFYFYLILEHSLPLSHSNKFSLIHIDHWQRSGDRRSACFFFCSDFIRLMRKIVFVFQIFRLGSVFLF